MTDSGLLCLQCEYNLTGTIAATEVGMGENRCPECGTTFDPDDLRARLAGAPRPIAVWDNEKQGILTRYIKMCLITWFMPWRLPRMIPPCYHRRSHRVFRWITIALAIGSFIGLLSLLNFFDPSRYRPSLTNARDVAIFSTIMLSFWMGIILCETLLGIVLVNTITPNDFDRLLPEPEACNRWWGIVGFLRSFILLGAACFILFILAEEYGHAYVRSLGSYDLEQYLLLALVGIVLWWWTALSITITRAPTSWGRRLGCIVFAPIAVVIGGVASYVAIEVITSSIVHI